MAASRRLDLLLKRPEALLHRRGHEKSLSALVLQRMGHPKYKSITVYCSLWRLKIMPLPSCAKGSP
jgi:hypothetical protein